MPSPRVHRIKHQHDLCECSCDTRRRQAESAIPTVTKSAVGASGTLAAVPALVKALNTFPGGTPALTGPLRYYADLRWMAAEALGAIGIGAKDAVPALTKTLSDVDPHVRSAAASALKRISGK